MYFHILQTGYLSDRNLESLSVCLLLHYYQHLKRDMNKSVRKDLSSEFFLSMKHGYCRNSGKRGVCSFDHLAQVDPDTRLSAKEILEAKWFTEDVNTVNYALQVDRRPGKTHFWIIAFLPFAGDGSAWAEHHLVRRNRRPKQGRQWWEFEYCPHELKV